MHKKFNLNLLTRTLFSIVIGSTLAGCNPFGRGSDFGNNSPVLFWNYQDFNFGDLNIGSSLTENFSLTNNGNISAIGCGPVQISDVINFSILSNTCTSASMSPNQSCQVTISTHPTSIGKKDLTISRQCADDVIVQTPEALITVTGVAPDLLWSPLVNDFGNIYVGSNSSIQAFTLTNNGNADATTCATPTLTDNVNFTITANNCGTADLAASSSCIVSVRANPMTSGNKSTTLRRVCSYGGTVSTTTNQITVTGRQAVLAWSPLTNDFGSVLVGSNSSSQTFTLSNSGNTTATSCAAPIINDTTNFSIISDTCSTSNLVNSASCAIQVQAHPVTVGLKSATVSRTCTVGGVASTTANQITVTGSGLASLAWTPLTKSFGHLNVGGYSLTQVFTLTNSGSVAATSCSAPTIDDNTNFTILADTCGTSNLAASGTCAIDVRANPTSTGLKTATVSRTCTFGGTATTTSNQITVNGTIAPTVPASLAAMATTSNIDLSWTASTGTGPITYNILRSTTSGSGYTTIASSVSGTAYSDVTAVNGTTYYYVVQSTSVGGTSSNSNEASGRPIANFNLTAVTVNAGSALQVSWGSATGASSYTLKYGTSSGSYGTTVSSIATSPTTVTGLTPGITYYFMVTATNAVGSGNSVNANSEMSGVFQPSLAWSPLTKSFGNVNTGDFSSSQIFTLANSGNGNATSCSAPSITDTTNFTITSDTCSTSDLAASSTCTITVRANPTTIGLKSTTLSRVCTVGGTVTTTTNQIITTGVLMTDWQQEFGLTSLGLVSSAGGTSNTFSYYFRNPTSSGLTGCTVPTLTNSTDFSITYDGCGSGSMSAVSVCEVRLTANPFAIGAKTGNLSRSCSESGVSTYALSATGVGSALTTVQVSAGGRHTCGAMSDGTVRCWGDNIYGQLGDGTTAAKFMPVQVSGITTAVSVSSGLFHTCAVLSTGGVRCWGANSNGQIGDGTTTQRNSPVAVSGITTATKVSTGSTHTCAVLSTGGVRCWGLNTSGQIGDGTMTQRNSPVAVSGITTAAQVSAGQGHTCALLSTGDALCWGGNGSGQIGDGTIIQRNSPVAISGITSAVQIAVGNSHSCAVLSNGEVKCWGLNSFGQLGDGTTTQRNSPVSVIGITTATQVSSLALTTCVRLNDQTAKCWGLNTSGQIGDGTQVDSMTPVSVSGLNTVSLISTGGYSNQTGHTCAVLSSGNIKCWGGFEYGQLGHGGNLNSTYSKAISGISTATKVSTGTNFSCTLLSSGSVQCWGNNTYGQLGNSTLSSSIIPVAVSGITTATQIAVGNVHACAVLSTGGVRCWGYNSQGQLGDGTITNRNSPVAVSGITTAVQIAVSGSHSCAVLSTGGVRCWGGNFYGSLGDGTTTQRNSPVAVSGITNATQISVGNDAHSCALLSNGTVMCWGRNLSGGLGNGTNTNSNTPVLVSGISSAVQISVGQYFSCALLAGGELRCWGRNDYGQLGNGTTIDSLTPIIVGNVNTVSQVSCVSYNVCALLTDQTVKCWGQNTNGILGDLSTVDRLNGVYRINEVSISTLGSGSGAGRCNVKSTGEVFCSGYNSNGQVGSIILTPQSVNGM